MGPPPLLRLRGAHPSLQPLTPGAALASGRRALYGAGMSTGSEEKAECRRRAAARRKQAHDAAHGAGAALRDVFLAAGFLRFGDTVSGYAPIRSEVDVMPLMTELAARGHRLCLPVIARPGRPLIFREWTPGCEMTEGPFGARVPARGERLEPTLLLVPLLAFDRRGYRLGYGGGFYDRTFERLRVSGDVRAVGVAYSAQELETVPTEPTDQRLDAIVTESGVVVTQNGAGQ